MPTQTTAVLISPARKRVALVAHDNMKDDLIAWTKDHRELLARHELVGTGTTARMVAEHLSLIHI